jgi:hypothetical protein
MRTFRPAWMRPLGLFGTSRRDRDLSDEVEKALASSADPTTALRSE